jgi:hypothetical protein
MRLISATSSAFDLVSGEYDCSRSDGFIDLEFTTEKKRAPNSALMANGY